LSIKDLNELKCKGIYFTLKYQIVTELKVRTRDPLKMRQCKHLIALFCINLLFKVFVPFPVT
jgi:hypothetical protein